ncbi:ferritin-like metal-binding protein YciE [Mycoplana sp. BE70]|nr:ferritin-like metal-binding protein YciE [Mycoplana sp. BE70]
MLVDELRDLLHAEKQLLKALPKMAKVARSQQLVTLLETHLETDVQVERLGECLKVLGAPARAKPCRAMAGLVEEGEEVMTEGKEKEDAPADIALIGAALRVEHYEIAAYTTARNLALQLSQPRVAQLLTLSMGEEQNAGQLLDQVAQPLMSMARENCEARRSIWRQGGGPGTSLGSHRPARQRIQLHLPRLVPKPEPPAGRCFPKSPAGNPASSPMMPMESQSRSTTA